MLVPFTKLVILYTPRLSVARLVTRLDLLMLEARLHTDLKRNVFFQSQASSFEFRYEFPNR